MAMYDFRWLRRPTVERLERRDMHAVLPEEQTFLYLLNLARHDPQAYASEHQLGASLAGIPASAPLAINDSLSLAGEAKADDMAVNNYFSHLTLNGFFPNQVARALGYPLPFFYSDFDNNVETQVAGPTLNKAALALDGMLQGANDPTHADRNHLLDVGSGAAGLKEAGVGVRVNLNANLVIYWSAYSSFANTNDAFLTGVAYNDANQNGRYDSGEGLSGVTIKAGTFTALTNDAGGYAIFAPHAGALTVTASGGAMVGTSTAHVNLNSTNVEVDFISGRTSAAVNFDWYHNDSQPLDVTGNGVIDLQDALQALTRLRATLRATGSGKLPTFLTPGAAASYPDVDGDGVMSINDIVPIIIEIRRQHKLQGEGEVVIADAAAPGAVSGDNLQDLALWGLLSDVSPDRRRR